MFLLFVKILSLNQVKLAGKFKLIKIVYIWKIWCLSYFLKLKWVLLEYNYSECRNKCFAKIVLYVITIFLVRFEKCFKWFCSWCCTVESRITLLLALWFIMPSSNKLYGIKRNHIIGPSVCLCNISIWVLLQEIQLFDHFHSGLNLML